MIKLTYEQLNSHDFITAMQELSGVKLPIRAAFQVSKILSALNREILRIRAEFQKDVGILTGDNIPEVDRRAHEEKVMEFGKRELTVDRFKIHLTQLDGVQLSPRTLVHLEPVLTEELEMQETAGAVVTPLHGT